MGPVEKRYNQSAGREEDTAWREGRKERTCQERVEETRPGLFALIVGAAKEEAGEEMMMSAYGEKLVVSREEEERRRREPHDLIPIVSGIQPVMACKSMLEFLYHHHHQFPNTEKHQLSLDPNENNDQTRPESKDSRARKLPPSHDLQPPFLQQLQPQSLFFLPLPVHPHPDRIP